MWIWWQQTSEFVQTLGFYQELLQVCFIRFICSLKLLCSSLANSIGCLIYYISILSKIIFPNCYWDSSHLDFLFPLLVICWLLHILLYSFVSLLLCTVIYTLESNILGTMFTSRYQPLDHIKQYFGVKIALYFAWLGFYTYMLIPASIVGLICFLYAVLTLQDHQPSIDICDNTSDIYMCPLCDKLCDYWRLDSTCIHAKISYLVDNPATVFFAVFMSFWAALFLEMWKRYSAHISHRWDLTGFDIQEEHPRPQYLARLAHIKKKTVNIVTKTIEPRPPFWSMRVPGVLISASTVLLLVRRECFISNDSFVYLDHAFSYRIIFKLCFEVYVDS